MKSLYSVVSLFLIPHSVVFIFSYIGIGTNSQTISADTDTVKNWPITDMISKQLYYLCSHFHLFIMSYLFINSEDFSWLSVEFRKMELLSDNLFCLPSLNWLLKKKCWSFVHYSYLKRVIRHLLRRQLLLRWYLWQQKVRVRVMIGFLVRDRVRIMILIRIRVGVTFNVSDYHLSNCRRSNCTFLKQFI